MVALVYTIRVSHKFFRIWVQYFITPLYIRAYDLIFPIQSIVVNGHLPSIRQLFDSASIPVHRLRDKKLPTGLFHLVIIPEVPSTQEVGHRPEQVVIRWRKVRTVSWVG